jgi:hypothetical protein
VKGSLTYRGWREADVKVIDQRREIGDVYSTRRIAIDIRRLRATERRKVDVQVVNQSRQVGNVHTLGGVAVNVAGTAIGAIRNTAREGHSYFVTQRGQRERTVDSGESIKSVLTGRQGLEIIVLNSG